MEFGEGLHLVSLEQMFGDQQVRACYALGVSDLLTIADVARIWGVHTVTVRRRIAAGRLRAERVGRTILVRREDANASPAEKEHPGFSEDDPLWDMVGMVNDPGSAWVSSDKHRALSEAYLPKQ